MKLFTILTAALLPVAAFTARAEEETAAPAKCAMCEKCDMCQKMKEKGGAPAPMAMCDKMKKGAKTETAAPLLSELKKQGAEIDKLVTTMNGSVGAEKLEAMAAAITRLAAENKVLLEHAAKAHPAAKESAPAGEHAEHQH